jgi:ABC-2 type transport system ATP-binding protein
MIVRCDGLTKRFAVRRGWWESLRTPGGGTTATVVDDVSFTVAAGEIFGLLGQNGAGKTTLFKMLATLISADEGQALVDGHDVVTESAEVRALLAPVLANERSLYWRLSAHENLRLYAVLQGLRGSAVAREIGRVLEVTGLAQTGAKMVGTFSSGMRQRLLIARALLGRPRILLLDEPTRSLDPISAREFRRFLRETVVGAEGCTVLLATHDADEVWDLCDRVAVLERGRLLAVDATAALRHRTGGAHYELWVGTGALERATSAIAGLGVEVVGTGPAVESGWDAARATISGDAARAAQALAALHAANVPVARFARVAPSLAELIERVVRTAGGTDA